MTPRHAASALLMLSLLASQGALAQESSPTPKPAAADAYEAKIEAIEGRAGRVFQSLGLKAKRWQLYRSAAASLRDALAYDPSLGPARKALGYKRRQGAWILDDPHKLPTTDGKRAAKRRVEWNKEHTSEVEALAERFRELARGAQQAGRKKIASRLWRKALTLRPDHPESRAGISHVRTKLHQAWVWSVDAKYVRGMSRGSAVSHPGYAAQRMGYRCNARDTPTLYLAGYLNHEWLSYAARYGEAAQGCLRHNFGLRRGKYQIYFLLLKDKKRYRRFLETNRPKDTKAEIDHLVKHSAGSGASIDGWYAMVADEKSEIGDAVIRSVARNALGNVGRGLDDSPFWVEGIKTYLSIRFHGTAEYFTVGDESRNPHLKRLWSQVESWPLRLRSLIQTGECISLEQLLKNRRFNSFSAADTAHSWSLIDFMIRTRQKGLKAYLAQVRSKSDVVAVFRKAFGETPAEVEAAWKRWALARY
jgi:tetratricopeptide (TPR) repeat protein